MFGKLLGLLPLLVMSPAVKVENEKINFSPVEPLQIETPTCPVIVAKEQVEAEQDELDQMWDRIQELKEKDPLAAQVMYEKYRAKAGIPPALPNSFVVEDQAVS